MRHAPLVVTFLLVLAVGRAEALVIESATRPDFAPNETKTFRYDRNGKRPAEVGGNPGEMSSLTKTAWELGYEFKYDERTDYPCNGTDVHCQDGHHHCGPPTVTITIKSFNIRGRQQTNVYLPGDAPKQLEEHEQSHADLNAYAYDQAVERARTFSRGLLRKSFSGESIDKCKGQLEDLFNRDYRDSYLKWRDELHQALNDLDGNGRGSGMKPADAYRRVVKERG